MFLAAKRLDYSFDESELWAVIMLLCVSTEGFSTQPQPIPRLNRPLELRLGSEEARRDAEESRAEESHPWRDKHAISN